MPHGTDLWPPPGASILAVHASLRSIRGCYEMHCGLSGFSSQLYFSTCLKAPRLSECILPPLCPSAGQVGQIAGRFCGGLCLTCASAASQAAAARGRRERSRRARRPTTAWHPCWSGARAGVMSSRREVGQRSCRRAGVVRAHQSYLVDMGIVKRSCRRAGAVRAKG